MKFETILVGTDFSPASLAAIRHACGLAGTGTVRLIHVVSTDLLSHHYYIARDIIEEMVAGLVSEAEGTIAELKRDLSSNGARIETVVRRGRPADEIVEAARGCDLVVLGAHSRDLLGRLALGSVAEEVARRSPVPTLAVRESAEGSKVERVLLAVDVVEPCSEAIAAGRALADRLGVRLEAIHVIPWPIHLPAVHGGGALAAAQADLESRIRKEAPGAVRSIISEAIGQSAKVHVFTGSPATEIIEHAKATDIIVCGTHGRGALGRLAFGSVATRLLRGAPSPVLIVRPSADPAKSRHSVSLQISR
jgi:nucleotide-binding universal stress UspA family protein